MTLKVTGDHMPTLERALGLSALRHKVISNNIANINTPGFKRQEVNFEDSLRQAVRNMDDEKLELVTTHKKHFPGTDRDKPIISSPLKTITKDSMRLDGNNVDIDYEMAGMAKNSIYYQAVAQQIGSHFSTMRSVIREGK